MKYNLILILISGLFWSCGTAIVTAQNPKNEETISKTFAKRKVLIVENINGSVSAEGYSGNEIDMKVQQIFTADSPEKLDLAKKEITLDIKESNDSTIIKIKTPGCDCCNDNRQSRRKNWQQDYNFKHNFQLKIPQNMTVILATINDGSMKVQNYTGNLTVNHINGGITLNNVAGKIKAHTINGELKVNYSQNPQEESSYYSLNGNVEITYPGNFSADVQLKSFNGEFYTDYEFKSLPGKLNKIENKDNGKTQYKVSEYSSIRIKDGGATQKIETFNGDIYIKKAN
jgi:DUF4097 and DUF4098 domain-containing protein YvlB